MADIKPMPVAEIRRLMEAPAVKPSASEERIAMHTFRNLSAYDRGRQVGQALGELFLLRRNPE